MHWEKVTAETQPRLWPYLKPCALCHRDTSGFEITALYLLMPDVGEDINAVAGPHIRCNHCYNE